MHNNIRALEYGYNNLADNLLSEGEKQLFDMKKTYITQLMQDCEDNADFEYRRRMGEDMNGRHDMI